ncbi:MAG: integrase catalytic subunit [Rhodospirillaceae bacterium]|nr:MAG: integrase catalytic subunit [Rhodospirillaceae bacterium]
MMTPELFCRLRVYHDHDHLSVGQIAHLLHLNKKTVAKWVKRDRFARRARAKRPSKLDAYKPQVVRLIGEQGLTAVQVLQRLKTQGYAGGYTILKEFVGAVRPPRHPAFLTLAYGPGECAQADWGDAGAITVGSTRRRLSFLVVVLCYSRLMYVEFTLSQALEHFLGALQRAFVYFKAVPHSVLVDNMKTAVLSHPVGLPAVFNPRFLEMAGHFGFQPKACGVRQPQAKGRVENGVGYVKKNLLNGLELCGLSAMNLAARNWLDAVANVRVHRETQQTPIARVEQERAALLPLNPTPFDTGVLRPIRATHQCRVVVDANRYSIPYEHASRLLTLKLSDEHLWLYDNQKLIAEHVRCYDRGQDFENPDHVRELLRQRQGARDHALLRRFLALSPKAEDFYRELENRHLNARHHVRQIMALAEIYPPDKVAQALEDAHNMACYRAEYIANILSMRERPQSEPAALHLTHHQDLLDLELPEPDLSIYDNTPKTEGDAANEMQ